MFLWRSSPPNNVLLRGGSGDVPITGVNPTAIDRRCTTVLIQLSINGILCRHFQQQRSRPVQGGGYSTLASINGAMDEFSMYSALTPAEVLSIFNTRPVNINNCPSNIRLQYTGSLREKSVMAPHRLVIDTAPVLQRYKLYYGQRRYFPDRNYGHIYCNRCRRPYCHLYLQCYCK